MRFSQCPPGLYIYQYLQYFTHDTCKPHFHFVKKLEEGIVEKFFKFSSRLSSWGVSLWMSKFGALFNNGKPEMQFVSVLD